MRKLLVVLFLIGLVFVSMLAAPSMARKPLLDDIEPGPRGMDAAV